MKRNLIFIFFLLVFGIVKGQSTYEKHALPVFNQTKDTTKNLLKNSTNLNSTTTTILAGQAYGGAGIQVFPSSTIQSEVHVSLDIHNSSHINECKYSLTARVVF